MKFNENPFTEKLFNYYELEGFGFNLTDDYSYDELENENLHEPNLFFCMVENDHQKQAEQLFESDLRTISRKHLRNIMTLICCAFPYYFKSWNKP